MPFNRRYPRGRVPVFILFTVAKAFVLGALVMLFWNYVLPPATGLRSLTYWQSVALWLLCRLLFGGIYRPAHQNRAPWRSGAGKEKWMQMTPEEREKFQQEWKQRCRKKD